MFEKSLKEKFLLYLIPFIVFISLCFLLFFINRLNSLTKAQLTEMGYALVKNLSYSSELAVASEDEIFLKPYLEKLFKEKDVVLVVVYNKKGRVILANKDVDIEERIPSDVLKEVLIKKNVLQRQSLTRTGDKIYDFYSPILISELLGLKSEAGAKDLAGFARVGLSLERMKSQNKDIVTVGLIISGLLIILGFALATFLANRMTKSIRQLTKGVEVIGKGRLDYHIDVKTGDEIEELGAGFNRMAEDLRKSRTALEESKQALEVRVKARTQELQELAESLEEKVKERTGELQQRVEELERFHHLTVGRELKMVELKKEIRKLEQELMGKKQGKKSRGQAKNNPLSI